MRREYPSVVGTITPVSPFLLFYACLAVLVRCQVLIPRILTTVFSFSIFFYSGTWVSNRCRNFMLLEYFYPWWGIVATSFSLVVASPAFPFLSLLTDFVSNFPQIAFSEPSTRAHEILSKLRTSCFKRHSPCCQDFVAFLFSFVMASPFFMSIVESLRNKFSHKHLLERLWLKHTRFWRNWELLTTDTLQNDRLEFVATLFSRSFLPFWDFPQTSFSFRFV